LVEGGKYEWRTVWIRSASTAHLTADEIISVPVLCSWSWTTPNAKSRKERIYGLYSTRPTIS
jgi:hypothetical protein